MLGDSARLRKRNVSQFPSRWRGPIHENHEASFQIVAAAPASAPPYPAQRRCIRVFGRPRRSPLREDKTMTWTTPQACDFRFGFEITMYVAAR